MKKLSTYQMILIALFTALIAVGTFIRIPVPFMDYFTLQFMFVLLSGMLLGSKFGTYATGLYVLIGLIGFPVFAAGGGPQYILKPTFGYLLGFIVTAFATGFIVEYFEDREGSLKLRHILVAAFAGMLITYMIGFTYKYLILKYYVGDVKSLWVIIAASIPLDVPGDSMLAVVSALIGMRLRPFISIGKVDKKVKNER